MPRSWKPWRAVCDAGWSSTETTIGPLRMAARYQRRFSQATVAAMSIIETNGAGVALVDYDSDGWLDFYVACDSTAAILYRSLSSYYSHDDLRLHLGLGAASKADRIEVRWPSGQVHVLENVGGRRVVRMSEASSRGHDLDTPRGVTHRTAP